MLVFFCILIVIVTINLILYFSSIRLEIEKVKIDTTKKPVINDYKVNIYLAFLNKIKYLKISVYKEKIDKMKNFNFSKIKQKITNLKLFKNLKDKGILKNTKSISKAVKKNHIKLEKLNFKAYIGLSDIVTLSYILSIFNILISIALAKQNVYNLNKIGDKYCYSITPKKTKSIYINAYLNAMFSLKISNIIKNLIYISKE